MTVKEAKVAAREWVEKELLNAPNFIGAFFTGSINVKDGTEELVAYTDVDVWPVYDCDWNELNPRLIRLPYKGILIELYRTPLNQYQNAEQVLSDYRVACHLALPQSIVSDPTGHFSKIQKAVEKDYPKKEWVLKRIENAKSVGNRYIPGIQNEETLYGRVFSVAYSVLVMGQIILLADLRDPGGSKSIMHARDILAKYDKMFLHDEILQLLGCFGMSKEQVVSFFTALSQAYDKAMELSKTNPADSGDFTQPARQYRLTRIQKMIEEGFHRESMGPLLMDYRKTMEKINSDALEKEKEKYQQEYEKMSSSLGLSSKDDFVKRAKQAEKTLELVVPEAEQIAACNPKIM